MPYISLEACTIKVEGQAKRGVRVWCCKCSRKEEVLANSRRGSGGGGYDDDIIERSLSDKFEKLGWKIGKNLHHNLCPDHNKKENAIMAHNNNGKAQPPASDKVVLMNSAASISTPKQHPQTPSPSPKPSPSPAPLSAAPTPRGPSRDEKRIIFQKIDEVYVGETVGYSNNWSDKRLAADLAVPLSWVAAIREENFGPDIDEESVAVMTEAKALLEEAKTTIQSWMVRADQIEKTIQTIAQRK
jgi:hypothetical protein